MAEDSSSSGAPAPTNEPLPDPAPTPELPSTPASAATAEPPAKQGLDWQLVALGAVLWIVAVGIVLSKWSRVRVDWQLGNIKERLDFTGEIDQDAVDTLVSMGTGNDTVVAMLGDEVYGPQRNLDDPRYRITLVKALEKIPGETAQRTLIDCLRDPDARVRANVYVSLETRAGATPAEAPRAVEVLEQMLLLEPEPVARGYVVKVLGGLGKLETPRVEPCWYFIAAFREAEDRDIPPSASQGDKDELLAVLRRIREECVAALRALSKQTAEQLPLDPSASDEVRREQVQAWEAWYVGAGGAIPEGQLLYDAWWAKREDARQATAAPVDTAAPGGDAPPGGTGADGPDGPGSKGAGG